MMLKAHQKFQLNHNQIYIIVHRSWLKMNRVLRASLRVPHPRLSFLFFWQKQKKLSPTVPHPRLPFLFFWQKQKKSSPIVPHPKLPFMPSSEKEPPHVSAAHPFVSEEVEGYKNNCVSVSGFLM